MSEPGQQLTAPKSDYERFVDRITTQVVAAMPINVPTEDLKRARSRFRVAFSADAQAALQECTPESVGRAMVLSAMSGLFPGGPRPDVWLIPRRNKHKGNVLEANWQMSFRGYIRLGRRALYELQPVLVFHGEKFSIQEGDRQSIIHERNLDLPKSWETLRYGYIRVFPVGNREGGMVAYLTRDEIEKRRKKAQDDSIWREWPLEMAYKTLCSYAGAREMFPTDDPARYAMEADTQAEIGGGASNTEGWGALPAGTKTAGLAARLAAKSAGEVIEVPEGRPLETVGGGEGETYDVQASAAPAPTGKPARLTPEQVATLLELCGQAPVVAEADVAERVNPQDGEEPPASKLQHVVGDPGETEDALFQRARRAVRDAKKATQGGGK